MGLDGKATEEREAKERHLIPALSLETVALARGRRDLVAPRAKDFRAGLGVSRRCHVPVTTLRYTTAQEAALRGHDIGAPARGQWIDELDPIRPETFVLRVSRSAAGELVGLIHHVRTGEKRRFEGLAQLNAAIRGLARRNVTDTGTGGR